MHIRRVPDQYRENLVKLVEAMEKTGAKLIWATTTPIMSRTGKRFDDIKNFNAMAEGVMKERKIAVNDLYTFVLPSAKEWQAGDKVHFNAVGNENLARRVSESIRKALGIGQGDCAAPGRGPGWAGPLGDACRTLPWRAWAMLPRALRCSAAKSVIPS